MNGYVNIEPQFLLEFLEQMKHGDCWCGKGIDNPMFKDHTWACKTAGLMYQSAEKMLVKS